MSRKYLPLILMLSAGAITCVVMLTQQYEVLTEMILLFVVLVVFYGLGSVLKWTLDYFEKQNEALLQAEGEVIEKEPEGDAADSAEQADEESAVEAEQT